MINTSWLLALVALSIGSAHAQQGASMARPDRRLVDAISVEHLVGSSDRFVVAYDRGALAGDSGSVIQVAEHQAGVIGPIEIMRGGAPIVPTSLPSGQRPLSIGSFGPTLGAWFWQFVPGFGSGWDVEPLVTAKSLPADSMIAQALAVPPQAVTPSITPQVAISFDKVSDGRIRVKAVGGDNSPMFDAYADSISMNSNDSGRIMLKGNVEINSHMPNQPARILGAAAVLHLKVGTIEVLADGATVR